MSRLPEGPCPDLCGARVALTGGTGFIGRHLVRSLQAAGADVVLLRWQDAQDRPDIPADILALNGVRANHRSLSDCRQALTRLAPSHVIHLAGFVRGDRAADAILPALDGNLMATAHLSLALLDALPHARLIVASTLDIANPWLDPSAIGSPYGISKAMMELLMGSLCRQFDSPVLTARMGMVYGPDDPNRHRLVPSVIDALLHGAAPVLGSGMRRADWVHVQDVCDGLIRMCTLAQSCSPAGHAVDLGTGQLTTVLRVANTLCRLMGSTQRPILDPRKDRPNEQERAADVAATSSVLNWQARVDLETGLADTIAWHRQRPDGPRHPGPRQAA